MFKPNRVVSQLQTIVLTERGSKRAGTFYNWRINTVGARTGPEPQKIQQDFCRCWKDKYLSRLQQRTKWLNPSENLKKDDVVLVKDERMSSSKWPLEHITNTHSGTDGLVRVIDVEIGKKISRRRMENCDELRFKTII